MYLDNIKRNFKTNIQKLQNERNKTSKLIGEYKKNDKDTNALEKDVHLLKANIAEEESKLNEISLELDNILLQLPNLPSKGIPIGKDESFNKEIYRSKNSNEQSSCISHDDLGRNIEMMDFENAAKMSGARFVILKKDLAKLERALCNFMIDLHVQKHSYIETSTPHLVKDTALIGTGQLPKFKGDLFNVNNQKWLIPTAEVTLTNIHSNSLLKVEDLPKRYVALTNCFRSEAGSAGLDTKGMIRLHEFKKVELVSFVQQDHSDEELERLTNCAIRVLELLQIPFRKILLSSGDMGFSASKTYDLEVWLPMR